MERPTTEFRPASSDLASSQTQSSSTTTDDNGYMRRGYHRELINNEWKVVEDKRGFHIDVYANPGIFMERSATVQVVTFDMANSVRDNVSAVWEAPLNQPRDVKTILGQTQKADTWRWIHCEGLYGPMMKVIAEETDWPLDEFAATFSWRRPTAEWANGGLRIHFLDETTHVWMFHKEEARNPVFITCTNLYPKRAVKSRWEEFVDFGDPRRKLLLRKDPSLMLYAVTQAIIRDLRATAFEKHKEMGSAYDVAMARPSQKSLRYFYELEQSLIRVKLDTTLLREAATNLVAFVDEMHQNTWEAKCLVSNNTRFVQQFEHCTSALNAGKRHMLKDQLGVIRLLLDELEEVTREAEAVASLAFNSLSFNTNKVLRLLAVLTIASVPLTVVIGILGISFDGRDMNGSRLLIILCSVGGAVLLCLIVFLSRGYSNSPKLSNKRGALQPVNGAKALSATQRGDLEAQNWWPGVFQRVTLNLAASDRSRAKSTGAPIVEPSTRRPLMKPNKQLVVPSTYPHAPAIPPHPATNPPYQIPIHPIPLGYAPAPPHPATYLPPYPAINPYRRPLPVPRALPQTRITETEAELQRKETHAIIQVTPNSSAPGSGQNPYWNAAAVQISADLLSGPDHQKLK